MTRIASLLILLAALLLPSIAVQVPAQQKTLVVTGYGGRWSEVMKKALIEPFEKQHGVKIELVTGITTEWVAKLTAGRCWPDTDKVRCVAASHEQAISRRVGTRQVM